MTARSAFRIIIGPRSSTGLSGDSRMTLHSYTMASFSRGFQRLAYKSDYVCIRCRHFSISQSMRSGHNRWSKIKHDKGSADAIKNKQRSEFSKEITLWSKCMIFGPVTLLVLILISTCSRRSRSDKQSTTRNTTRECKERYMMQYNPLLCAEKARAYTRQPASPKQVWRQL